MTASPPNTYRHSRLIFVGTICLMWFLLLWGLGYMVATKLPGEGPVSRGIACIFFPVGFFPVVFFGAPGMLIGFLQKYLAGEFSVPPPAPKVSPPLLWRARHHNNPWLLGLNRLVFFWPPAVLASTLLLWLLFPDGISRPMLALALGVLGVILVAVIATTSTGRPFLHEINIATEERRWQGSYHSYLLWRHGIPWGLGNGLINAVLAIPLFPISPGGSPDVASAFMVSVDTFATAIILCFFMAISAHPHALVDRQLGVICPPENFRAPTWGKRIALLVLASFGLALLTELVLIATGITGLSVREFMLWKTIMATGTAGAAAMAVVNWTLASPEAAPDRGHST